MTTNLIKINPTTTAQTIDLTPSWGFAVKVYLAVLENPSAPHSTKIEAKEEILKLARFADSNLNP